MTKKRISLQATVDIHFQLSEWVKGITPFTLFCPIPSPIYTFFYIVAFRGFHQFIIGNQVTKLFFEKIISKGGRN